MIVLRLEIQTDLTRLNITPGTNDFNLVKLLKHLQIAPGLSKSFAELNNNFF